MSKIDQLRRQREEQHALQEKSAAKPASAASAKPSAPAPVRAAEVAPRASSRDAAEVTGACSVCGKTRVLNGGLVSNHQKGLGKMCPGSRKEPA